MRKKELLIHHPIHDAGFPSEEIIPPGGFGAVLARAGVGKTAFLVQLALHAMLQERDVLHVSLHDPVNKIDLWYRELFQNMAGRYGVPRANDLWQDIMVHRFIMTFKVDTFTVPKLEERLTDLTVQGIFHPRMLIMDGLHFDETIQEKLAALKALAARCSMAVWFTVHTHRHEAAGPSGQPVSMDALSGLFDAVILLQPEGTMIPIQVIKGLPEGHPAPRLFLDPATLLIGKTEHRESA